MIKFYPSPTFNKHAVFPEFKEIFRNGVNTNNGPKIKQLEQTLYREGLTSTHLLFNNSMVAQIVLWRETNIPLFVAHNL